MSDIECEELPAPWMDVTSQRHQPKGRTRFLTWELPVGPFCLTVTRHVNYPDDMWLARCPPLFELTPLKSPVLKEAACQAVSKLHSELNGAIDALVAYYGRRRHTLAVVDRTGDVKPVPAQGFELVQVSDEWMVLLKDGQPHTNVPVSRTSVPLGVSSTKPPHP